MTEDEKRLRLIQIAKRKKQLAQSEQRAVPGAIPTPPPQPKGITVHRPASEAVSSVVEPLLTIGSGIVAEPVAGIAGLMALPFGADRAADIVGRTREALTIQPRTEAGQRGMRALGGFVAPVVEPLMRAEESLGETGFEMAGPVGGAIGRTVPTALLSMAGPIVSKAGKTIERSGRRAAKMQRREFVDDLVMPPETKKVLTEQAKRTDEVGIGPFKRSVVEMSPDEKLMSFEVKRVPRVSKHKTMQGNLTEIIRYNRGLAKNLDARIEKANVQVPYVVSKFDIDDAIDRVLRENPIIPVDRSGASSQATRFANHAKMIIEKHPQTAKGLLDARKEFDAFAKGQRANVFTTEQDPAVKLITYAIRDAMNDRIGTAIPRFKADLRRQSALFRSIDNIAPKAAEAKKSAIARIWDNSSALFGTRNKIMQGLAVLGGTSVLGAATAFSPTISVGVGAGGALLLGGKVLTAPQTRQFLGKMIALSGQALGEAKDKRVISQLKADRIALIEALKTMREEDGK